MRTPVSIDTHKPSVASRGIAAGATMINDVWGLKRDPGLARVAADSGVPMILMHNQEGTSHRSLMPDIVASLGASIKRAQESGVSRESIIVDPGFGKTVVDNLEVVRRLAELNELGRPILLGSSRKSTIGRVLGERVDRRMEGTVGRRSRYALPTALTLCEFTTSPRWRGLSGCPMRSFVERPGRKTPDRIGSAPSR